MEEKIGFPGISLLLEGPGYSHELIVVNPEIVFFLGVKSRNGGKAAVHVTIPFPEFRPKNTGSLKIVKKRPQESIGKSFVISRHLLFREKKGYQPIACVLRYGSQKILQGVSGNVLSRTGPADPISTAIFKYRVESRYKPSRSGSHMPFVLLFRQNYRKPIRNYYELRLLSFLSFVLHNA